MYYTGHIIFLTLTSIVLITTNAYNVFAALSEKEIKESLFTPDSKPYNITLPDWTAKWWKWAISFSGYNNNPLLDPNGSVLMKTQPPNEPMFFLSGAWNSVANRSVNIPSDKGILFPVLNAEISFIEYPHAKNENDLMKAVIADLDAATYVEAQLDGIPIPHQRIKAPLFDISYANGTIFGGSGPTKAVADGYWVFFKPLPVGKYKIHLLGEQPFYRTEVTYDINIVNP